MPSIAESYDELPYPDLVYPETNPNRLAAIAALLGLPAKDPARSRILELGCGSGSNLISMAAEWPEANLVGVDFSGRQIDAGKAMLAASDIHNVVLHQADLTSIGPDWGQFDYIIAHGLYSWVPAEVQTKILAICRAHLAPAGIAYISYNCYPGWHMRSIVRDMLTFHTARIEGAQAKVQQSRALLEFMANNASQDSDYARMLKGEAKILASYQDGALFHEYLEHHNTPIHFHQFAERAATAGLQYMGDANPQTISDGGLSPEARETLYRIGNRNLLQTEQYLDFLRNRSFRQSLLVHQENRLQRVFDLQALHGLCIASPVTSETGEFDPNTPDAIAFSSPNNPHFSVSNPLIKAVLAALGKRWPESISFHELASEVSAMLNRTKEEGLLAEEVTAMEHYLLSGFLHGNVELTARPWQCRRASSDNPKVTALNRHQAAHNLPIVNQRHQIVQDNLGIRLTVQYLDGEHSTEALAEMLLQRALGGEFQISRDGKVVTEPDALRRLIAEDISIHIKQIAALSLLID